MPTLGRYPYDVSKSCADLIAQSYNQTYGVPVAIARCGNTGVPRARISDVFALHSHTENFGITVAEAMACGLPVLISKEVNIWREIESDGAGLAAADDPEGTASLLERWLAMPDAERERMRASALRSFSARFELNRFAHDFVQCLKSA